MFKVVTDYPDLTAYLIKNKLIKDFVKIAESMKLYS